MQVIAIALGSLTELDSKAPLLKTPHTLFTRSGEIQLVLAWKLLHCWIAFQVPEDAVQPSGGEKTEWFLPTYESCEL